MKKIWVWTLAGLLLVAATTAWKVNAQSPAPATRSIQLENVTAPVLAPKLKSMLGDRARGTEIRIDQATNTIVLHGPADNVRMASQLVEILDRPSTTPRALSPPVVKAYPVPPQKLDGVADRVRAAFASETSVRIATDNRTGQLLVVAPPELQSRVGPLLNEINPAGAQAEPAGPLNRETHVLKHTTWRDLENGLRLLWGGELDMQTAADSNRTFVRAPRLAGNRTILQINRSDNSVVVTGSQEVIDYWLKVVRAMDSEQTANRSAAIMPLGKADPSKIQQVVNILGQAAIAAAQGQATTIGAATRSSEVVSLLFQQDGQPAPDQAPAPAEEADSGLIGDVQLQFVPELGIIIVKGHRRDVEKVKKIIAQIKDASETSRPEVAVEALEHVNSIALGELLNPIYEEVYEPRQGPLSITALGKPNAMLLIGSKENIEIVRELIKELDKAVPPQTVVRVFQLEHMSATTAAEEITELYTVEDEGDQTSLRPRVNAIPDFRSNSLIVQAGPRDMQEIEDLIKRLDTSDTPARIEVRVFPLKNALAETLATTLSATIAAQAAGQTGQPGGGQTQNQDQPSQSVTIVNTDPDGNNVVESGILTEVVVTADANTNSLVVRAPSKSMPLIATLIQQLDKSPEAESQIKVFEIRHGDATNLTLMLQELFGLEVTAGSSAALRQTLGALGAQPQLAQSTAGESSLIPLRFTPEPRSNSIVASGSSADLEIVEALLIRLDEDDIRGRRTQVYRLNNASAQAVSDALTLILNQQLQLYQTQVNQQFSTIGQQEFLDQQVFVQPEVNSNSLVVSATPELFDMISDVIADLDRRPPMVMIQVVIAEITLDEREETGAEVGIQDSLLFDRGLAVPIGYDFVPSPLPNGLDPVGLASRGLVAGQGFSALGVGRTSASAGFPGLVISASNESVSVLIRALESSQRMQVLSRPQIMTMHNVPASVLVGQRVPRVTDITQNAGTTTSSTTLDDVGLSLGVIPRVTPDGLIVMDLEVTKSSVGDTAAGIEIQPGIRQPIYTDTTAITTLSARDGQTIVFSGLISKERVDVYRGVPLLSSIPIVGRMFRFDQHNEKRSELLIFMTPHIVYSGEDEQVDWINVTESGRMSWCLADVVEMHGNVGLSPGRPGVWSPKECPVIFPDGTPMYESPAPTHYDDLNRPHVAPDEAREMRPYVAPESAGEARPFVVDPAETSRLRPLGPQPAPEPSARLAPRPGVQPATYAQPAGPVRWTQPTHGATRQQPGYPTPAPPTTDRTNLPHSVRATGYEAQPNSQPIRWQP